MDTNMIKWGRLEDDPVQKGDFLPVPKKLALSIYAVLLDELTPQEIIEFWNSVPLPVGGEILSGLDLIHYLWETKADVPSGWINAILLKVEPYLIEREVDFTKTLSKVNFYINRSSFIPGSVVLYWLKPVLSKVSQFVDARALSIHSICMAVESHTKGCVHQIIDSKKESDLVKTTVIHGIDGEPGFYYANDYNFFYSYFSSVTPRMFGAAPIDNNEFLGDARPLDWILKQQNIAYKIINDELMIEGKPMAYKQSFSDFYEKLGLKRDFKDTPPSDVYVMKQNLFSKELKRNILYAGCAYGTPFYIIRHCYHYKNFSLKDNLENLVDDIAIHEPRIWEELNEKHKKFLANLGRHWTFTFDPQRSRIICNGDLITRGVSAWIMRQIIQHYLTKGQVELDYTLFREDPEISSRLKDTSLELRIIRLLKNVEKKMGKDILMKSGRGIIRFQPESSISYKEMSRDSKKNHDGKN